MREIKFRLWNLKNKYMFSNDNEELLLNIDGSSLWGHKTHYYDGTDLLEIDDFEIMQYTGFKDINGVEIYEGDIIREDIEKGGPPIIVSVAWEDGAFYGKERTHNPEYLIKEFLNGKIIGNIHENPELLED